MIDSFHVFGMVCVCVCMGGLIVVMSRDESGLA